MTTVGTVVACFVGTIAAHAVYDCYMAGPFNIWLDMILKRDD